MLVGRVESTDRVSAVSNAEDSPPVGPVFSISRGKTGNGPACKQVNTAALALEK
jgi:hypothetical protein